MLERNKTGQQGFFQTSYVKLIHHKFYAGLLYVLGLPVHVITFILYIVSGKDAIYEKDFQNSVNKVRSSTQYDEWLQGYYEQEVAKATFFKQRTTTENHREAAKRLADRKAMKVVEQQLKQRGASPKTYNTYFAQLLSKNWFVVVTIIPAILMYALLVIYKNPFLQFIFERLVQTAFVIVGVAILVFTILYLSPFDPARNILGVGATNEQIANFNRIYGLDQPYFVQLWDALRGLFTFDLGTSYAGKEDVAQSIITKFPVTLEIAIISLLVAIAIAIPIGIISAVRPNSIVDYTFMFIALIGLSIPSFWQGLIMILTFSIELKWLPATYNPNNALSLIMPIIVLGTSLTASIARMTRSSMLEVIHEDYIITARAKGLSERKIISKHAIKNAMIPIITVIGLLFGGMLGGASVTEKVFNISGIGSYIVDKQFIPDIPAILAGVVYIAITISIVNLIIDICYNFFDPRIRSKMKKS